MEFNLTDLATKNPMLDLALLQRLEQQRSCFVQLGIGSMANPRLAYLPAAPGQPEPQPAISAYSFHTR